LNTPPSSSQIPFYRDVRVLQVIGQIVFVIVVIAIIAVLVNNTFAGLQRAGLVPSFDFLNKESSFQIDEGLVNSPHTASDTFFHAFMIGLINTLRVLVVGLVGASVLGLIVGIMRLSSNWLVSNIARMYIEIFQNTPLLVQLIFIYQGIFLRLPELNQDARPILGVIYITNKGLAHPALWPTENITLWTIIMAVSVVVAFIVYRQRRQKRLETGQLTYAFQTAALIVLTTFLVTLVVAQPYTISYPEVARRTATRYIYVADKGVIVSPEYVAVCLGLILYTGAFIAEIVRSGIQSVANGQWEAARSLGLANGETLRLVILPQALRVMFPPLTNQYSALLKNSALGAYIGFTDLFGVGRTIQLQSGQSIPVTLLVMAIYLGLTLIISYALNLLNARFQLKTR
jgi:general L-amino acid transport system permease protein